MGVDPYLLEHTRFTSKQLVALAEKDIKTRDNLADLSSDELVESLKNTNFEENIADDIIMDARKHWFDEK